MGHHVLALNTFQQPPDGHSWVAARQKGPPQALPSPKCPCSAISTFRVSRNQVPKGPCDLVLCPPIFVFIVPNRSWLNHWCAHTQAGTYKKVSRFGRKDPTRYIAQPLRMAYKLSHREVFVFQNTSAVFQHCAN